MSHAHTLIRNAAKSALTGLTTTGSRVFANRLYALSDAELPALRVSLDDETVEPETIHGPVIYGRTLTLIVEACAKANAALDDTCDQMQLEVETVLASGLTVDSRRLDVVLSASRFDEEAAEMTAGVKRMEFSINFFTLADSPDSLV